jgi:2-polyprenyl-3-methyl-5-hydroxy-6-metoxy-1,4-benzoquinol methylase
VKSDLIRFYLDGDRERLNVSLNTDDSVSKAGLVASMLRRHELQPATVTEVGCGAGAVLATVLSLQPKAQLQGWDIAPRAERFWAARPGLQFTRGDFLAEYHQLVDLLLLDVIEHVANPHEFLIRLRPSGRYLLLRFSLDLSVASVWRETPLPAQRPGVGHPLLHPGLGAETARRVRLRGA